MLHDALKGYQQAPGATPASVATLQVIATNLDGWRVSTHSRLWGKYCRSIGLGAPFPSLLQPPHLSFHVNFSTPFTPPHSDIRLLSAGGVLAFIRNTSFLPVQIVTTVYSIDIIFSFNF